MAKWVPGGSGLQPLFSYPLPWSLGGSLAPLLGFQGPACCLLALLVGGGFRATCCRRVESSLSARTWPGRCRGTNRGHPLDEGARRRQWAGSGSGWSGRAAWTSYPLKVRMRNPMVEIPLRASLPNLSIAAATSIEERTLLPTSREARNFLSLDRPMWLDLLRCARGVNLAGTPSCIMLIHCSCSIDAH